jgi:hypothetical protein
MNELKQLEIVTKEKEDISEKYYILVEFSV